MSIKTVEFTKTDGRKVTVNPASVQIIEQEIFDPAPESHGQAIECTVIACFGYFIYLDERYEDVTKKIWGE